MKHTSSTDRTDVLSKASNLSEVSRLFCSHAAELELGDEVMNFNSYNQKGTDLLEERGTTGEMGWKEISLTVQCFSIAKHNRFQAFLG